MWNESVRNVFKSALGFKCEALLDRNLHLRWPSPNERFDPNDMEVKDGEGVVEDAIVQVPVFQLWFRLSRPMTEGKRRKSE